MMNFIDIDTLSLSLVVITLFMGIVLIYLGRVWKNTIHGVTGIGISLIVVASTLTADIALHIAGFGNTPSTVASIILVFAFFKIYVSISLFRRIKIKILHHLIVLIPGTLVLLYLGFFAHAHSARIIVFSLFLIYYSSTTGLRFLKAIPTGNKSTYIHLGVFFLLFAAMNVYRIIYTATDTAIGISNDDSFHRIVYLIIAMLLILLACTSFIMMVNKELSIIKEQITSIMAHDLKNPLATIISYTDILKNEHTQSKDEQGLYLTLINDAAGNSLDMIYNMMEWSKLSFGKTAIINKNANIKMLLSDLISNYRPSYELKNINIRVKTVEDCIVHTDATLTNTILRNLLSNAIKYSPEDDEIIISCKQSENYIRIDFTNHGPHINEQLLQDIRNRKIIHSSIEKGKSGSGLGLFLCAKYIDLLDGKLEAENLDIGCRFSILFPIKEHKSEDLIV